MQEGFRVAFEHHGDRMPGLPVGISVVNSDGTGRELLRETGSTPAWSPDGNWIAFNDVPIGYEAYATNIFIMRPNGQDLRQLTFHQDSSAYRPRWNSNSQLLVYSLYINEQYRVYCIEIGSGKTQELTQTDSYAYPEWMPTGDIVALNKAKYPASVVIMSGEGRNIRNYPLFNPGDEEMTWSPNGKMIAFNRYGFLCVMNSDGSGLREFEYGGPGKAGVLGIAWMPDSSGVAFTAEIRDNSGIETYNAGKELFLFDLSLGCEQPLVTNPTVGAQNPSKKRQYAEIIDVTCSPQTRLSQPRGFLRRLLRTKP